MKTKKIFAFILSMAIFASGLVAVADSLPGKTWDFESIGSSLPEGFSMNNKNVKTYNQAGAKGVGKSFGFMPEVAGAMGKGNGVLKATSNGVKIDASEYIDITEGSVVIRYDFMIENENLNALLVAPVLGSGVDLTDSIQLNQKKVVLGDVELGTVSKNTWYNVAAKYNFADDGATVDIYFDGAPVQKGIELPESYNEGFSSFAILTSPKTGSSENFMYENRKEILNMDNLYIGQDVAGLAEAFKLEQVKQASEKEIDIVFNRPAKTEEMTEDVVKNLVKAYTVTAGTMDGEETEVLNPLAVSDYSWKEAGKVLVLIFRDKLEPGTTVEISISPELISDEGVAYTGDATKRVEFKVPNDVNMFWDFNDKVSPPKYFNFVQSQSGYQPPANAKNVGASGKNNDTCFTFLVGIGIGSHNEYVTPTKYTNGFRIFTADDLAEPINDTTIVVNYDFKPHVNYMEGWLVAPSWSGSTGPDSGNAVKYFRNQTVMFGEEVLGNYVAGEWQNIGVVYHLSSTEGTTIDVWYNGIQKISGYQVTKTDGITGFTVNSCAPHDTSMDTSNRYDGRNEYFAMDNLYIGTDMSYLMDSVLVESATPAINATDVPVDTELSVRLNDKVVNESAENLISLETVSGETVPLKDFSFANENYVIRASYNGVLNYEETYRVTLAEEMVSQYGYNPDKGEGYTFTTESVYSDMLEVSGLNKENGVASAEVEFSGDEALLVMASYDDNGAMLAATTATQSGNMSVSCPDGATVQVFAIDSLEKGTLLAKPFMEEDNATSYYQYNTTMTLEDVTNSGNILSFSGTSNLKNAYVFAKITKDSQEIQSDSAEDYLGFGVTRTDGQGAFTFCAYMEQDQGTYSYSAKSSDMKEAKTSSAECRLNTEGEIKSLSLDGQMCTISGTDITLMTTQANLSDMLMEFELSDDAKLYVNGEKMMSGISRIDVNQPLILDVVSELGETFEYTLKVSTNHIENSSFSWYVLSMDKQKLQEEPQKGTPVKIVIKVNVPKSGAQASAAVYDANGRMTAVTLYPLNGEKEIEFFELDTVYDANAEIKLFLFRDIDTMSPIENAVSAHFYYGAELPEQETEPEGICAYRGMIEEIKGEYFLMRVTDRRAEGYWGASCPTDVIKVMYSHPKLGAYQMLGTSEITYLLTKNEDGTYAISSIETVGEWIHFAHDDLISFTKNAFSILQNEVPVTYSGTSLIDFRQEFDDTAEYYEAYLKDGEIQHLFGYHYLPKQVFAMNCGKIIFTDGKEIDFENACRSVKAGDFVMMYQDVAYPAIACTGTVCEDGIQIDRQLCTTEYATFEKHFFPGEVCNVYLDPEERHIKYVQKDYSSKEHLFVSGFEVTEDAIYLVTQKGKKELSGEIIYYSDGGIERFLPSSLASYLEDYFSFPCPFYLTETEQGFVLEELRLIDSGVFQYWVSSNALGGYAMPDERTVAYFDGNFYEDIVLSSSARYTARIYSLDGLNVDSVIIMDLNGYIFDEYKYVVVSDVSDGYLNGYCDGEEISIPLGSIDAPLYPGDIVYINLLFGEIVQLSVSISPMRLLAQGTEGYFNHATVFSPIYQIKDNFLYVNDQGTPKAAMLILETTNLYVLDIKKGTIERAEQADIYYNPFLPNRSDWVAVISQSGNSRATDIVICKQ